MSYVRSTAASRKALAQPPRYLHVSVNVVRHANGDVFRTPIGKGATARKNPEIEMAIDKARKQ